eukprot:4975984-Pleurochrysis_carterae.AAC.1
MLIANAVASRITMVVADSSTPPPSAPLGDANHTHRRRDVAPSTSTIDGPQTPPTDAAQSDSHETNDDDLHQHFQR